MHYTPKSELDARVGKLQALLAANDLDGALIVQNTDLFYFAGTIQQSHLYIPVEGLPILMTRRTFSRAQKESALDRVVPLSSPRDVPRLLREQGYPRPRKLGLELDVLPANLYLGYREILGDTELCDASPLIRRVRAVKSSFELVAMRHAARIAESAFEEVGKFLVEGITEIELAGKVEAVARAGGHQGLVKFRLWNNEMFYGHLMAGASAAQSSYLSSPTGGTGMNPAFPQGASLHRIRRGEPVLLDYVFVWDGYIVDQTRILALESLSDRLLRAHAVMVEIQNAIADTLRPGMTGGEVFQLAVSLAERHGYAENLGGIGKDRVTFVGHGVGLELDEYPFLAKGQAMPLEAGMVIAIEPKVTFPKVGTVGIENQYVVTERGAKRMTRGSDEVRIVRKRRIWKHANSSV